MLAVEAGLEERGQFTTSSPYSDTPFAAGSNPRMFRRDADDAMTASSSGHKAENSDQGNNCRADNDQHPPIDLFSIL